jgi:hypothetical protein
VPTGSARGCSTATPHQLGIIEETPWPRAPQLRRVLNSVSQVYPRSLDFDVVAALVFATAA